MRKTLTVLSMTIVALVAGQALAEDHLVSREAARERVLDVATQRARSLATIDAVLATPAAAQAAQGLGADTGRLRAALPTLSDAEIADLAARADALQSNPVAGLDDDI
ncbi:MAG TPA: hypothetical protein VFQ51_20905, partial [Vicinamibacteria bacterium]|nr:hypothetical protein [Vicinamibacteria bacterium]